VFFRNIKRKYRIPIINVVIPCGIYFLHGTIKCFSNLLYLRKVVKVVICSLFMQRYMIKYHCDSVLPIKYKKCIRAAGIERDDNELTLRELNSTVCHSLKNVAIPWVYG